MHRSEWALGAWLRYDLPLGYYRYVICEEKEAGSDPTRCILGRETTVSTSIHHELAPQRC